MSTHNICFRGEIRKIFTGYPLLSRPMDILITSLARVLTLGELTGAGEYIT